MRVARGSSDDFSPFCCKTISIEQARKKGVRGKGGNGRGGREGGRRRRRGNLPYMEAVKWQFLEQSTSTLE